MRNIANKGERKKGYNGREKRIKKSHNKGKEITMPNIPWLGAFIGILGTFLFLSLISYSPLDDCLNVASSEPVRNICRKYGAIVADLALQSFGLGAWVMVATLYMWAINIIAKGNMSLMKRTAWMVIAIIGFSTSAGFFRSYNFAMQMLPGGYVGYYLSSLIEKNIGEVIGITLSAAVTMFAFYMSIRANKGIVSIASTVITKVKASQIPRWTIKAIIYILTLGPARTIINIFSQRKAIGAFFSAFVGTSSRRAQQEDARQNAINKNKIFESTAPAPADQLQPNIITATSYPASNPSGTLADGTSKHMNLVAGASIAAEDDGYMPPSINLLTSHQRGLANINPAEHEARKIRLTQALKDFGVNGVISNYHVGPVVTLYELQLEPGTKAGRVIGLANDVARAMQVPVIRIADIPSRGIMGIEVPNPQAKSVGLKEILMSPEHQNTKHSIPMVLGQDIMGKPIVDDLAKMPHLLVAGTTGSGKSVGLNGMIVSMLYKMSPKNCRFIMIDPKMLELSLYNGIPHLLTPAITDPAQAILAMRWVVQEMQKRNKKMANLSVRNISGYNQKVITAQMRGAKIVHKVEVGYDPITRRPIVEEAEEDPQTMPYIVVIIDEMADLMMVAGKEMEGLIQRIAQMARAAGIHLIMATQRPSVDVITGVIKANLSTRISYKVASKIDSGIIIGEPGAEQLLGNGDMLYLEAGKKPKRVHGPFLSEQEVEAVVKDLSSRYSPSYVDIISEVESSGNGGNASGGFGANSLFNSTGTGQEENDQAMYRQAIQIVLTEKKTSISYIQRKLRIGYNKAANFIEKMEEDGILSAPDTTGKRNIIGSAG